MSSTLDPNFSTDDKDPTLIGAHCTLNSCNRLDFLPFKCESCRNVYCLEHRSENSHNCSKAGEWAARRRKGDLSSYPLRVDKNMKETERKCASLKCQTTIGTSLSTSVHCSFCNQHYCLRHRMKDDHDCSNQTPNGSRSSIYTGIFDNQAEHVKVAFSKLKAWGINQKAHVSQSGIKARRSAAGSQILAVNNLKKIAKGDDKLPIDKRIYIHVDAEATSTSSKFPSGAFFYSKDWVIGKVLDAAAKSLQILNINNECDDEMNRLRVFHIEKGRLLDFNEKVCDVLVNGDRIVLLRGIGPSIPDLIDLIPK
ncbi:AN1-type zinc finger protein 1 [Golovinomyces cichoracearum]|uniref:AN1-type zinc finger protein 1 n=1 Tax=Golovinomyces cichoracearum TaxID=62708 RepID=A0A420HR88_9PEZI|nr:AN1-type zinc finger protein 1 [Golovinomyces cichoracearum]